MHGGRFAGSFIDKESESGPLSYQEVNIWRLKPSSFDFSFTKFGQRLNNPLRARPLPSARTHRAASISRVHLTGTGIFSSNAIFKLLKAKHRMYIHCLYMK